MRLRQAVLILLLWGGFQNVHAQVYEPSNAIPVIVNGDTLTAAWAGGLNAPQFNSIDLNQDGILDLIVSDRVDGKWMPFLNGGTPNTFDYHYAPHYLASFPSGSGKWLLTRDYNGDGKMDLFCGTTQGSNVMVYKNTSTSGTLSFALASPKLYSRYPTYLPLYSAGNDIPAIEDIDQDGDLDFLTFHVGGSYVEWHQNQSIELYGHADSLIFEIQSRCFGHFQEDSQTCTAYIGLTPCAPGERHADPDPQDQRINLHAGSTMLAIDLDGDALLDLVVGDVDCGHLYALHNAGTHQIAHFDFVETDFPSQGGPVNVINFPAAFYLDLDNDGIRDLISAPNATTEIEDMRGVQWHKNIGTDPFPNLISMGYGLFQDQMIETGTAAMPAFLDHNGDGLWDLILGNRGTYDSLGGSKPSLSLYENVGTAQAPAFQLLDDDYLQLKGNPILSGITYLQPAITDLDGDGDHDLVLGKSDGQLLYFRNIAPIGSPADFFFVTSQYQGIDVGLNSAPYFYDLDADQDQDLIIGNLHGYISFYRNTGNRFVPNFEHVTDSFGQVKINDFTGQPFTNGYARPLLLDWDHDQTPELLVGTVEGAIQIYDNVSTTSGATFSYIGDLADSDFGSYAAPAAAQLDSTGWTILCGTFRGGLNLLKNTGTVAITPPQDPDVQTTLFPNPATHSVTIQRTTPSPQAKLQIINPLGQILHNQALPSSTTNLDLQTYPPGIYFIQISTPKSTTTIRLAIVR